LCPARSDNPAGAGVEIVAIDDLIANNDGASW
jgi:hypothetical protein